MRNKFLVFICLFALYSSTYKPMTQKTFDFGEGVCYYKDVSHNSNFEYVKPCESGKKCLSLSDSNYNIKKCQEFHYLYRTLNDPCTNDEECPGNLKCKSNKCDFDGDKPYGDYCPYGKVKVYETSGYTCKEKSNGDKCEVTKLESDGITEILEELYNPGYFKLCGLIDLQQKNSGGLYYKKTVSSSFYGSVADGSFVEDKFACEHGFALYFYGNNKYRLANNPSTTSTTHQMFLKCVTLTEVDENKKVIKYKIGESGTEQYYLINELTTSDNYKQNIEAEISAYTMTKLEIFKNYKKRYDEIKDDCAKTLYIDESKTCRDDELRKWFYFYQNPWEYILYKNDPQVMEYLVQEQYENYKAEHTTDSSGFLSLNILIILLFLLSL